MIFGQIPAGATIFLDANVLVYHFGNEPTYGAACTQLVKQVEQRQLSGFTSAHVLAEVSHRLMAGEAMALMGWPQAGIALRLRKNRHVISKLSVHHGAIASILRLVIQVLPITQPLVEAATLLSQRHELLTGDALIVAAMQHHGLTNLASSDLDFDHVPGIVRYAPP